MAHGQRQKAQSPEYQDVINPATAKYSAKSPLSGLADVAAAVEAAAAAYPESLRTPAEDRIQPLFKLKQLMEEHLDDFGRLITLLNGEPPAQAKAEMRRHPECQVACGSAP